MNNVVILEKEVFYKDEYFSVHDIKENLKKIPKNINLIIADEEIMIKIYENIKGLKDINNFIDKDFFYGDGILMDTSYDNKKKRLIVYGIKENPFIRKFYKNNIESINPIQKVVSDYIIKNKKEDNIKFIFKFHEKLYLNIIENKKLIYSKIINKEEKVMDKDIKEFLVDIKRKNIYIF